MSKSISDIYNKLNDVQKSLETQEEPEVKEVEKSVEVEDESANGKAPKKAEKSVEAEKSDKDAGMCDDTKKCDVEESKDKASKSAEDGDPDEGAEKSQSNKVEKDDENGDIEESAKATKDTEDDKQDQAEKSIDEPEDKSLYLDAVNKSLDIINSLVEKSVNVKPMAVTKSIAPAKESVVKSVIDDYNSNVVCAKLGAALYALEDAFCDASWDNNGDDSKYLDDLRTALAEFTKILDNIEADDDDQVAKSVKEAKEDEDVEESKKSDDKKDDEAKKSVEEADDKAEKSIEKSEDEVEKSLPESKAVSYDEGEEPEEESTGVSKSALQDVIADSINDLEKSQLSINQDRVNKLRELAKSVGTGEDDVEKSFIEQYNEI